MHSEAWWTKAGLAPVTLQSYTSRGKADLVRGEDFFVRRTSPYRRQLMFTKRGLLRLRLRAYRVYRDGGHTLTAMPPEARPVNLRTDFCHSERRSRLKAAVHQSFRNYLEHPCAVPNCPCMTHRLVWMTRRRRLTSPHPWTQKTAALSPSMPREMDHLYSTM